MLANTPNVPTVLIIAADESRSIHLAILQTIIPEFLEGINLQLCDQVIDLSGFTVSQIENVLSGKISSIEEARLADYTMAPITDFGRDIFELMKYAEILHNRPEYWQAICDLMGSQIIFIYMCGYAKAQPPTLSKALLTGFANEGAFECYCGKLYRKDLWEKILS